MRWHPGSAVRSTRAELLTCVLWGEHGTTAALRQNSDWVICCDPRHTRMSAVSCRKEVLKIRLHFRNVFVCPHLAINCGRADRPLRSKISLKSCGHEVTVCWKNCDSRYAAMQLQRNIYFSKKLQTCSCGSPSLKLRNCNRGHRKFARAHRCSLVNKQSREKREYSQSS